MNACECMQQHVGGKVLARNAWGWLRGCWGVWWLCRWVLDVTTSPGKIHGSGGVGTGYDRRTQLECTWVQTQHTSEHVMGHVNA